jgi:predicted ArsR family transcriptional regulator
MPTKGRRTITDPKELRALAHPVRMRLIKLIAQQGKLTATQCAAEVGESVANCSYHLNMLAKYDYIEQAEGGQGREKPWQLVHEGHSWSNVNLDPEAAVAAEAASRTALDFALDTIRERFQRESLETNEWREALGLSESHEYLTPAELEEMRSEIDEIMRRYKERREDPSKRPDDARPVTLSLFATVAPSIKPE